MDHLLVTGARLLQVVAAGDQRFRRLSPQFPCWTTAGGNFHANSQNWLQELGSMRHFSEGAVILTARLFRDLSARGDLSRQT